MERICQHTILTSIPDLLGRVVLTGICTNTFSYSSSPLLGSIVKSEPNNQTNTTKGYLVSSITLENLVVLSANYYDDYSFTRHNGIPDSTDSSVEYKVYAEFEGFGKRYMPGSKGLLTGTLTARLDDSSASHDYLYSVMYYDAYRFSTGGMNAVSIDSKYLQLLKEIPLNYTPLP